MAQHGSAAQKILAVQDGFSTADQVQQTLESPATSGILKLLSDGRVHRIDEIAEGQTLNSFKTFEILKALETAGLVDVNSSQNTIELTTAGEAAASSI